MPRRRKSASLGQFALNAFASVQLRDRGKEAFGVRRATQEVGGFFERHVVFEREHYNRLFAVASDDQGVMVVANSVHGTGQVGTRGGVSDGIHSGGLHICTPYCTITAGTCPPPGATKTPNHALHRTFNQRRFACWFRAGEGRRCQFSRSQNYALPSSPTYGKLCASMTPARQGDSGATHARDATS